MWSKKNSGKTINIDGKSGSGEGNKSSISWNGMTSSYPTSGTQGGGYSTSGTSGGSYSVGSYSSSFLSSYTGYGNSQGLGKLYTPEEVLGMSGYTAKNPYGDSQTIDQIIEYCNRISAQAWGSNAILRGGGEGYMKAINLGGTDMHDRDSGNLFYTLRNYNFNLEILNLSNNRIGDAGVESMIYGITGLQYQTLYSAENGWKPYQSTLKTVQNVITINLSNNQIGDKGAEVLAYYLAKGDLPSTKVLDVSGNQITNTGKGYLANSLNSVTQDLKIVLESVKGFSKEALKVTMKGMLSIAKSNGVNTKEVLTTGETIEHCKKGSVNVGLNLVLGFAKCFTNASKPLAVYEMDFQTLGVEVVTGLVNPLKKPIQFICMVENTVFSVVDEEFANCLVGVDSGLNE